MSPLTLTLISLGICAAVVVAFLVIRNWPTAQDEKHHFKCPKCGQKIGYRKHQIGRIGICSQCRQRFAFPNPLARK